MVQLGEPLRHANVTCIFRLEQELENGPRACLQKPATISRQATVRRDSQQSTVSIGNQPHGNFVAGECRCRQPKGGSYKIVVEEWGAHGDLRFLKRKPPILMPRGLF